MKTLFIEADEDHVAEQHGRWLPAKDNKSFMSRLIYIYEYKQEVPGTKGKKEYLSIPLGYRRWPKKSQNWNLQHQCVTAGIQSRILYPLLINIQILTLSAMQGLIL